MPTFNKVVLPDGKPAILVGATPFSPAWFRVRLLGKDIVNTTIGGPSELLVRVEAYQVDSAGAVIADGEGPVVERIITAESLAFGAAAMTNERVSIAKEAIRKAARSPVDIGSMAQMSRELVD